MKSDPTSSNTSCSFTREEVGGRGAPGRHLEMFLGRLGTERGGGGEEEERGWMSSKTENAMS